jgi:aminoglycoside phosphotransferase (APT) family kinase protein
MVRALAGSDPRRLVLRRLLKPPWSLSADDLLQREAGALSLLAGTAVPAPELVAVDPVGEVTDAPALLMTHLPGRVRPSADRATLDALARVLVAIHRIEPALDRRPPKYVSWVGPDERRVPPWASDPAPWQRALALIDQAEPDHEPVFLHRDFHPGNVLFSGGEVTGVVDWVETSWGPPELDVAHCQTNLALLHGVRAADEFRAAYRAAGGRLRDDQPARAYWELIDALAFLPDPGLEYAVPAPPPERIRRRLEEHVFTSAARTC